MVQASLDLKRDPCSGCNGPRERCMGRPRISHEEASRAKDQAQIRSLLLGPDEDPIEALKKVP